MDTRYHVDSDITVATTLPGSFYRDDAIFALTRERVFARTWQWLGDTGDVALPDSLSPRELLPGLLDEPVLLARDTAGTLRCLSNVCTHRSALMVSAACRANEVQCPYHARRFALDGRVCAMFDFETACDVASAADHLPNIPLGLLGPHAFASIDPAAPFDRFFGDLRQHVAGLPLERCRHDPARDRDYHVAAHWALYVEHRLDDLHATRMRASQEDAAADTVGAAATHSSLYRYARVQAVMAGAGEPTFDASLASGPSGQSIAAYRCWIFPNLLLDVVPSGLTLRMVLPLAPERTRVAMRAYVWDERKRQKAGPGMAMEQSERDDEAMVERLQRGVRSRWFRPGRYSPMHEEGVHHFHRLLCEFLDMPPAA